jgi:hypothetical protein
VEREVRAESITAPKKHLALDTDWASASVAICAFFVFGLVGAGVVWMTLQGHFRVSPVTWWTPLFAGGLIWVGISGPDKLFRLAVFSFVLGPVLRIALWLARASTETRLENEIFVRWIDSCLYLSICVYTIYWFSTKIKHV